MSIPKYSALMFWLVTWSADLISRYQVHATGRTSHDWITGHRCDRPIAGFAEKIHCKFTTDKNHRNKMITEWNTGFFICIDGRNTEYLVATQEGSFSCATIRNLPDDEAYDPALFYCQGNIQRVCIGKSEIDTGCGSIRM